MDGAKCTQPGCGGTIEGGFCNRCGLEPPDAGPAAVDSGASGLMGGRGSAAIGSSRSALSSSERLGAGSSRRTTGSRRSSSRKHLGLGPLLTERIHAYLDAVPARPGRNVEFQWEGKTYSALADAIFVVHPSR